MDWMRMLILAVITFYSLLMIMKVGGIVRKQNCPVCEHEKLEPEDKSIFDQFLNIISLNILPVQRCKCESCGWEGILWKASE